MVLRWHSRRWLRVRRCRYGCRWRLTAGCRSRSRRPPTIWSAKRSPTRPNTHTRRRRQCTSAAMTDGCGSRSPTTDAAAPTWPTDRAFAGWPTGSPHSTADSRSTAPPPVARQSARRSHAPHSRRRLTPASRGHQPPTRRGRVRSRRSRLDRRGSTGAGRAAKPDVAIVDIRMPPTHSDEGLKAAQEIRARHPDVGVLVLSQYVGAGSGRPTARRQRCRTGIPAQGSHHRPRRVRRGNSPRRRRRLRPGSGHRLPTTGRRRDDDLLEHITPREREVLALMAEGYSNQAIADRLVVTVRAVEKHVTASSTNSGCRTPATAIAASWPSSPSCAPSARAVAGGVVSRTPNRA